MSDSMLRIAVALSAALHGMLGMWVEVRHVERAPALREVVDSWSGPGIEVDAIPATRAAPAAPAAPAAAVSDNEAPATVAPREHRATPKPAVTTAEAVTSKPRAPSAPRSPGTPHSASPAGAATTAEATAAGTPDTTSPSSTAGAAFGAAGLPAGVRHLPKAFTRALGIASRGDKRWLAAPLGAVGEARLELSVDEDGHLGELVYPDATAEKRLAPVVRHLFDNVQVLLASGRFSLDPSKANAGVQRLRVRVEVTERVAAADPSADPEHEYEAPTRARPGHGSFTLEGGRRVTSWVYLE